MSKVNKIILGIVIGCVFIGAGIFGVYYIYKLNKIETVLLIDINPSLKLSLNYKNEIIKAEGLNKDGKDLLSKENFKGDDLEDAVEEIVELSIENGYMAEEENHILINVEGKDIKKKVTSLFNKELKEEKVNCNIIIQEINEDVKNKAEEFGISESKVSYIENIIKENSNLTFEELKDKSISEINKYVEDKEVTKEENNKEEQEKEESKPNNSSTSNNSSSNNNSTSNKKPNKKPVSTPPASNDRTGAWCEFYNTIPPEGGVDYETPGYISEMETYSNAARNMMPADADWSSFYTSITSYRTASYCSAGIVEVENYEKTKTYTVYIDSVTLELLELKTKELEKAVYDEAASEVIIAKWLMDNYGVDINDCGWTNYYYNIDGSTKKPEWQYTCKIKDTTTYYAVTVNAVTGVVKSGYTWTN